MKIAYSAKFLIFMSNKLVRTVTENSAKLHITTSTTEQILRPLFTNPSHLNSPTSIPRSYRISKNNKIDLIQPENKIKH